MMLRLIDNMRFSLKLHTQYLLPHAMPSVMQMLDGAVSERSFWTGLWECRVVP